MSRRKRRGRRRGTLHVQKRSNALEPRVQRVGPDRFGILAVDPAKHRFSLCLANFYAKVLAAPFVVENTRSALEALPDTVRSLCESYGLQDLVVAIERTGRYYIPIREALKSQWSVRMVHPFATKQLRQPADPGNKTEPTDLMAMVRAVVVGYSTREQELPDAWARWRLVSRERESRVNARRRLRVQVEERLHAVMPGYSLLVEDFWKSPIPVYLARRYRSAEALQAAGAVAIADARREDGHTARADSITRALQWALQAPPAQPCADLERDLLADQFALLDVLNAQIEAYERQLAQYLVDTPGILLLSMQGVNIVSAGSYMAELGPIEHYTGPSKITGRAGLYPSRYQSDTVDRPNGPLVGHHNARLRDAIQEVAHNLLRRNSCFRAWAAARQNPEEARTKLHVAAACKFTRISYWMLAGRQVFTHPAQAPRDAVLHKLLGFGRRHHLDPETTGDLLRRAARQLPGTVIEDEARALAASLGRRPLRRRRKGPVRIGEVVRDVIRDLAPGLLPGLERSAMAGQQLGRSPL